MKRVLLYSNADDGARPARRLKVQRPVSYSTNRHIQSNHFVILTIFYGEVPHVSTHPALPRLEPSRRPLPGRNPLRCLRCRSSYTAPWIDRVPNLLHAAQAPCLPVPAPLRRRSRKGTRPRVVTFECALPAGRLTRIHSNRPPPAVLVIRANRCTQSAKPKNSSGSPRLAERSSDRMSKQYCVVTLNARALPASEGGDDEAGTHFTCSPNRSGYNGHHYRLIEHPVQPLVTWVNLSTEHQRSRVALCKCKNHIRNINRRQN